MNDVTRVGHDRFRGLAVIVNAGSANQNAGFSENNITSGGSRFSSPVRGHLIRSDLPITLFQRDVALEQQLSLCHLGIIRRDL